RDHRCCRGRRSRRPTAESVASTRRVVVSCFSPADAADPSSGRPVLDLDEVRQVLAAPCRVGHAHPHARLESGNVRLATTNADQRAMNDLVANDNAPVVYYLHGQCLLIVLDGYATLSGFHLHNG